MKNKLFNIGIGILLTSKVFSQTLSLPNNATLPSVTTGTVTNITATTAYLYGNITDDGKDPDVRGGICFSTSPNPTTASFGMENQRGVGSFSRWTYPYRLNLTPNTTYYVRAYATNAIGLTYGNEEQFTTGIATQPTISTDQITEITATTAIVHGTGDGNGNDPFANIGVCYGTSPNPTTTDSTVNSDSLLYNPLRGLTPNTTYYVRSYASNAAGIVYGNQLQFTTSAATLPVVTTDLINNITGSRANGYETLTDNGNDPNTMCGICFSTTPNPTVSDGKFIGEATAGAVPLSTITYALTPATTYYARAYASNAAGIAYGSEIQFTTSTVSLPVVSTDLISNVTNTNAQIQGTLIDNGNDSCSIGMCYSTSPNPTTNDFTNGNYIFGFTSYLMTLNPNTTYYVRAYAINSVGTSYGNELQFTTDDCFANYTTTYNAGTSTFTLNVDDKTTAAAISYLWDFGDGTSSTDIAPSHTYAADGIYNVCMSINTAAGNICTYCDSIGRDSQGHVYRTAGFSMIVKNSGATAVSEVTKGNTYSVYPNPSLGNSTIVSDKILSNATINVVTITGEKVVEMMNCNGYQIALDIASQASGIYFVEVINSGEIYRTKLIKQ
jgi:PKD repeat protein